MNSDRKTRRNNHIVGAWVRFRRQRSGHTLSAAAHALSLTQELLSQIENGDTELPPTELKLMVDLYWISMPELVELNERLQSELISRNSDFDTD